MIPYRACAELDSVSGTWFGMTTEGFPGNYTGAFRLLFFLLKVYHFILRKIEYAWIYLGIENELVNS